jgi:diguanylate cyclase (GGDEF)-like protein
MLLAVAGLAFQLQVNATPVPVDLTGPWRFRAGDDPAWAAPALHDADWDTLGVPGFWRLSASAAPAGIGWYRATYTVREAPDVPLGLWFRSVIGAFEVYVDGRRVGGAGGFPPNVHGRAGLPVVVPLPPAAHLPGLHVIAVRAHSASSAGGIVGRVTLGTLATLEDRAFASDPWFLAAAILLIGLALHQIFFWLRSPRGEEHPAIIAVSLGLAVFYLVWMPSTRLMLEPVIYYRRAMVGAAAFAGAAYCIAVRRLFELDGDRVVAGLALALVAVVPAAFLVPGWVQVNFLASWVENPLLLAGAIVTTVLAVRRFRDGSRDAKILLAGNALLALTMVHAVLVDFDVVPQLGSVPYMTLLGSVGFVFSLALVTAERFVDAETAALYDRLTGLYRREVVLDALSREIRRAARMQQPLAVIMLDVDRFKQINDTMGHQVGDKVLGEIGRRMREAGRVVDWLGRYGGEEFIAILASTDRDGARQAAERLRRAVAALPIATGRTARTITLSAGVAAWDGGDEWPTPEQLVGAADAALYRAKNGGRDQVAE